MRPMASREPLTRERIVRAAITLIDRDGMDALTMRSLADDLGSGPMSLYRHVRDRDDLLDGIIELLAGELEPPAPGEADTWDAFARVSVRSVYRIGHAHPNAFAPLVARRTATAAPQLLAVIHGLIERLVAAGLDEERALLATRTLANFLMGALLSDTTGRMPLPGGELPGDAELEAGLETILLGIAAQLPPG